MKVVGVGVDIVNNDRIKKSIKNKLFLKIKSHLENPFKFNFLYMSNEIFLTSSSSSLVISAGVISSDSPLYLAS